jgi:hypothetical protein
MINEFYIVQHSDSGCFLGGDYTVKRLCIKRNDFLLRLKRNPHSDEEFEYLHFSSGQKVIIHNLAVKKL